MKKTLVYFFICIAILSFAGYSLLENALRLSPPVKTNINTSHLKKEKINDSLFKVGNNWLHLNQYGLWEMYMEGKPYERGYSAGMLCENLIQHQEDIFVDILKKLNPSEEILKLMNFMIAVFNRNIDEYIPEEFLQEIYGISQFASEEYNFIAYKYDRILNYHAAHDIGHMLRNYKLGGCSTFAVWGVNSSDSTLLVGRNFDFYLNDKFAENKIIQFCKPDSGYGYVAVTWAGMCGTVSGMNEKGLTVCINAAKSPIPSYAADPVPLIAREILQYAENIDQAFKIAKKRHCFVSENYIICSIQDNGAAIIEKTPHTTQLYKPDQQRLICTNHFQSSYYQNDELNKTQIANSASTYRYERINELLDSHPNATVSDIAGILRNQKGMFDSNIGTGNEKSVNQLICHHSVIFKPDEKIMWISIGPFQLGEYIAYDLDEILNNPKIIFNNFNICKKNLFLPQDSFLLSSNWANYELFRKLSLNIENSEGFKNCQFSDEEVQYYISLNSEYYKPYEQAGDYSMHKNEIRKAIEYYILALTKEIPTIEEKEEIELKLVNCHNFFN